LGGGEEEEEEEKEREGRGGKLKIRDCRQLEGVANLGISIYQCMRSGGGGGGGGGGGQILMVRKGRTTRGRLLTLFSAIENGLHVDQPEVRRRRRR